NSIGDPNADLCLALHRILPTIRFLESNTEDTGDWFTTQAGAVLFGVFPVRPGCHQPAPRLAIGKQRVCKFAYGFHIQVAERPTTGIGNEARPRVDLPDLCIPETPEFEEALLSPENVLSPRRILRVIPARQIHTVRHFEILLTMNAIT